MVGGATALALACQVRRAGDNVGALMIRIGLGGIVYHTTVINYNREPPKPHSKSYSPYIRALDLEA